LAESLKVVSFSPRIEVREIRSLLLKALQRFLHDEGDKRHAHKRGGDLSFVSWDDWMTEAPTHLSIPQQESDNWSPERIFDVRWAATVVERALRRLGDECESAADDASSMS